MVGSLVALMERVGRGFRAPSPRAIGRLACGPHGARLKGNPSAERLSDQSRTMQALALMKSYYPFLDLKCFETGFAAETDEAKFDELLSEVEPIAHVLAGFM